MDMCAQLAGCDRYVYLVVNWRDGGDRLGQHEFGPYDTHSDGFRPEQITEDVEAWKAEHPDRQVKGYQRWGFETVPAGEKPDVEATP